MLRQTLPGHLGALRALPATLAMTVFATAGLAMTLEQCSDYRAQIVRYLPMLEPFQVESDVSGDGWCRVQGPGVDAGAVEWRAEATGSGFTTDFRAPNVDVADELLQLTASAAYNAATGTVGVDRIHLIGEGTVSVVFSAEAAPIDLSTPSNAQLGIGSASLTKARLGVSGGSDFVSRNLADMFGLDIDAAEADETEAAEQRQEMTRWLDGSVIGPARITAWKGFSDLIAAYPSGTAGDVTIALRAGQSIPLQTLAALWFDISKGRAPDRKGLSSLEVTWTPR